jgi:hypothetical protein
MSDIIEYAETLLQEWFDPQPERFLGARGTIRALITALKATRAELANYTEFAEQEFERLHREED